MKSRTARPWLLALLTLGVALAPVGFAWRNYRDEARRKDAQLFEATSALAAERLQLIAVRHINVFNILRNQLRVMPAPELDALRLPPALKTAFPHLIAFGYAAAEGKRAPLRWTNDAAPMNPGDDLAADARIARALERAARNPVPVGVEGAATNRLIVVGNAGEPGHARGYIVGWLDLGSLCRDASVAMVRDGVLTATPLAEGAEPPAGARVFSMREGEAEWRVVIARGPRFVEQYGQLPPTLVLATGGLCAVLLAVLVLQGTRAARLRAALDAERMRGRLVQSFSHEFRTPLSVILSSADLLEAGGDQLGPERRGEALAQIQDSTRRLAEMAEEILLLSRLESQRVEPRPVPVDLREFCEALARETTAATRERCRIEVVAGGTATLDATLLRGALTNLLSNAVKYSAPGADVRLAAERRNGALIFTVADDGIGIPAADLPRIGEPFQRAANVGDTTGTGLGLAIAHRSAALLGGGLKIESREGAGTTATLTLPA